MSGEWSLTSYGRLEFALIKFRELLFRTIVENEIGFDLDEVELSLEAQERIFKEKSTDEEKLLYELLNDLYFVLHEYNYYQSGDTSYDTFLYEFERFKKRWLR